MKSLRNILMLLIASGILASGVLTAASMWGSYGSKHSAQRALVAKDVTADILPPPMYLIELRLVLSQAVEGSMPLQTAQGEVTRLEKEYVERQTHWTKNPPYGLESHLLGKQHDAAQRFIAAAKPVLAAVAAGDTPAAQAALKGAHSVYGEHRAGVDETVKASGAFAESALASFESIVTTAWYVQSLVFGLSAVLLVVLGLWARKSVWAATGGEPVEAAAIASAVATGDLSVHIPVRSGDAASVMAAMGEMRDNLAKIVTDVRQGTAAISGLSSQIAEGNADLSHRTEQQAASLEETASSMEELTSTVKQSAENARQANQLAAGASAVAVKGGEVVGQVVSTMSGISEASRKIADIIGVIDGIAFQTNILALNAAVEAARAGEQGRGFAVVATEVRTLAQRSAAAAKEIKTLIQDSVEKVESGSKLVDQAGRTMEEIVGAVKKVTDIMAEIASAAQEQSSGIEQVNQAVTQMDQVTQQNAALVEQAAAAAESMQEQVQGLARAMAVFRTAHGTPTAVPEVVHKAAAAPQRKTLALAERPTERRGENRPRNIVRLPKPARKSGAPAATAHAAEEDWSEF